MEKVIKKLAPFKKEIFLGLIFLAGFLFFRLLFLTKIPIFVDEAIYLRWAQIAKNDANWRFISLTDGKQPMYVWLTMLTMKVIKEPLLAGRVVSVGAGLATMIGLWFLSFDLFGKKRLAFFASLLYLVIPFYFLHDRMALMDSLVGAFAVWGLFLTVLLVKTLRLDVALILGFVLGGGVLTKTSGFLTIYMLPLSLLLFDWKNEKETTAEKGLLAWFYRFFLPARKSSTEGKKWPLNLAKWFGLVLVAVVISQFFYSILRLSPFFHIIAKKNSLFIYPLAEWLSRPFYFFWSNLRGLTSWLVGYLTWPIVFLVLASLFLFKPFEKAKALLFFWFLFPFLGLVVFGKTLFPRFILFMSLPLLVLAAWSLEKIATKLSSRLFFLVLGLFLFLPVRADFYLLFNPAKAPIPERDRGQYITSWTVGYGVEKIVDFAKRKAQQEKIFIGTEGNFGLFPASLELYLWDQVNVEVKGYWPVDKFPQEVLAKAKQKETFFVFNENQEIPSDWPLKLIAQYPCPDTRFSMRLYQVISQ